MLFLQLINTAVYYYNTYSDIRRLRTERLTAAAHSVESSFDEISTVLDRILDDPVALEFNYRDSIDSQNTHKLHVLLRNLYNLEIGGSGAFRIYVYFHRSGSLYGSKGIVSSHPESSNRFYIPALELSHGAQPERQVISNATVETIDGVFSADVVAVRRRSATAVAVLPKSKLDERLSAAVAESGSVALAVGDNGVIIADCGALPLPSNCHSVNDYSNALKAQYGGRYDFELLENGASFGDLGVSVLIGFDRSTHVGGSIDLNRYIILSCACFLVITALFVAILMREIYSPMKSIMSRLAVNSIPPEKQPRNEFKLVDLQLNMLNSRVKSLSAQLEKHDELYLENVLARLSMDTGEGEALQYTNCNRRYLVLTAASESDGGEENLDTIEQISSLLCSRFRTKRFYHQGRQWSFWVETNERECDALLKSLFTSPLAKLENFTFIGISRIHNDILELRSALEESWAVFTAPLELADKDRIIFQYIEDDTAPSAAPNLNMREESVLVNSLLSANSGAVRQSLNSIISNNLSLSLLEQRELHIYLFKLLLVTQRGAGIQFPDDDSALSRVKHSYNVRFMRDAVLERYLSVAAELAPDDKLLQNIQQYVAENYMRDVYLQRIADEFNLSYSYVSRYFKRKSGIGFSDYVTQVRIGKAKELLTETSMSISAISQATGFDVPSSFNRSFKKNTGVSPGEYRSLQRKDAGT